MSNKGIEFEEEFANEMGLTPVPGSGSQWHSKLDVSGQGARWSLKYRDGSFRIDKAFIDEAVSATVGIGGTGEIPLWAIRLSDPKYDLVLMRKDDFKAMQAGELKVIPDKRTKTSIRTRLAEVPSLLREENELDHEED